MGLYSFIAPSYLYRKAEKKIERKPIPNCLIPRLLVVFTRQIEMSNARKYPYVTTDGFHVLPPPCLRKFQNALPPLMPSEFHNRDPPHSPPEFPVFFGSKAFCSYRLFFESLYEQMNMNLYLLKAVI